MIALCLFHIRFVRVLIKVKYTLQLYTLQLYTLQLYTLQLYTISYTQFSYAQFSYTQFSYTQFSYTQFSYTQFSYTQFIYTQFSYTQLIVCHSMHVIYTLQLYTINSMSFNACSRKYYNIVTIGNWNYTDFTTSTPAKKFCSVLFSLCNTNVHAGHYDWHSTIE